MNALSTDEERAEPEIEPRVVGRRASNEDENDAAKNTNQDDDDDEDCRNENQGSFQQDETLQNVSHETTADIPGVHTRTSTSGHTAERSMSPSGQSNQSQDEKEKLDDSSEAYEIEPSNQQDLETPDGSSAFHPDLAVMDDTETAPQETSVSQSTLSRAQEKDQESIDLEAKEKAKAYASIQFQDSDTAMNSSPPPVADSEVGEQMMVEAETSTTLEQDYDDMEKKQKMKSSGESFGMALATWVPHSEKEAFVYSEKDKDDSYADKTSKARSGESKRLCRAVTRGDGRSEQGSEQTASKSGAILRAETSGTEPGAVHVEGPHFNTPSSPPETPEAPPTDTLDSPEPFFVPRVVQDESLMLVQGEPIVPIDEDVTPKWKRHSKELTASIILILVVGLTLNIVLLTKPKLAGGSEPSESNQIIHKNFVPRPTPPGCAGSDQSSRALQRTREKHSCISTDEELMMAVSSPSTAELVLCNGTAIKLRWPIEWRQDNSTICCEGEMCSIVSRFKEPSFRFIGDNVWLQGIEFIKDYYYEDDDLRRFERAGNVIIQGGGNHYIQGCSFDGGEATQQENFDKDGGNLKVLGIGSGNIEIAGSSFTNGRAINSGGGLFMRDTYDTWIKNCLFLDNKSKNGGGMALLRVAKAQVLDNIFGNNKARIQGGAIWADNSMYNSSNNQYFDNTLKDTGIELNATHCSNAFIASNGTCFDN